MDNSFIKLLATKQNMDISEVSIYIETFVFGFAVELQTSNCVHFDPYGVFEVEKVLEYIKEDDNGCKVLMPPSLKASFSSSAIFGVLKTEDEEVDNSLYQLFEERHEWTKEAVSLFIAQIKSTIKSQLLKDKKSCIPEFGTFDGELGGEITFTFDEGFENQINKPFAHFAPVKLSCSEKELSSFAKEDLAKHSIEPQQPAIEEVKEEEDTQEVNEKPTVKQEVQPTLNDYMASQREAKASSILSAPEVEKNLSDADSDVEQQMTEYDERLSEIEKKLSSKDQVVARYKRLALFLGVLLLIVLAFWYWTTLNVAPNDAEEDIYEEVIENEPQKTFAEMEEEMMKKWADSIKVSQDTIRSSASDSVLAEAQDTTQLKVVTASTATIENEKSAPQIAKPDPKNTTHTLKSGETLRGLALRYYGTKELWTKLVEANKDVIKDPNNVPVGTTLRIPVVK